MDNFILSFNVVFPLFLIMAVGYVLKWRNFLSEQTVKQMNQFVFKVALPLSIYNNIINSDLKTAFDGELLLLCFLGIIGVFLVSLVIVLLTEKDNPKRGSMLQAMFRSNFVIFGVPVATSLFGADGAAKASIAAAIVVPVFNVLAVITLVVFGTGKFNPLKILKGIVTNPLIIASALGILCLLTGFTLPSPIRSAVNDLAKIATPLAFVVLGASFHFSEISQYIKQLSIVLSVKLLIAPAVMVLLAISCGLIGVRLAVVLAVFGSPVAVSSFTMAQTMGGDDKLAAQLVVFSSILSIVTMFFWIFGLKQLMFF